MSFAHQSASPLRALKSWLSATPVAARLQHWTATSAVINPPRTCVGRYQSADPNDEFSIDLFDLLKTAIYSANHRHILLNVSAHIRETPPAPLKHPLLQVAGAVLQDVIENSLAACSRGHIDLAVQSSLGATRLVIEDDGWIHRSRKTWFKQNEAATHAVASAGGELLWYVEWATNRTMVSLYNPAVTESPAEQRHS